MNRYTEVTEISREQFLQLEGLLTLARHHKRSLDEIARAACQITGEKPGDGGHTDDATYCEYNAETLLEKLEIKVKESDGPA